MSTREFETYLALLVRLLPVDPDERESIRAELRSHLEDRFDELLAHKIPHDDALRRAIEELGDAAHLAAAFTSLSRTQRRRRIMRFSSATLVAAVLALLALTAFWPTDPAVGPAARRPPIAPSQAQAQAPIPPKLDTRSHQSEIRQKLSRKIDAEFVETPMTDVLNYLSDTPEVQFHLNRRAMDEAEIAADTPVNISLKQVKADTVLRLVLHSAGTALDFVERDGFILVSTIDDLDRMTEVRVYNCRDLLSLAPPVPGGEGAFGAEGMGYPGAGGAPPMGAMMPGGGGLGGFAGSQSKLSGLIQTAVESDTWDTVGGAGSISEFNGLLVVKQSGRVHEKIDELLSMLRKAADLAPHGG